MTERITHMETLAKVLWIVAIVFVLVGILFVVMN
ncbi:hypothetical protein ABID56_000670 [Alkalibacillus flavidus]|uniref:Uncharacterized protein n=1 Tax=Alkalibacillus flavidus TaxID=546021 RepID=A0ABV2KSN9_9BACI